MWSNYLHMEIKSFLAILRLNKRLILLTAAVTVGIVIVITFMTTPVFTATTTLRVATASGGAVAYSDYMYADRLMNTYTRLATSRPVLDQLAIKLDIKVLPQISVETIPNTELLKISVESTIPAIAQNSANTLATILITQGKELYSGGSKSTLEILAEQLKQAEDELHKARQELDTIMSQIPKDASRIAVMNEAIKLKEATYATLLEQYDQARLRDSLRANLISIVEPAVLPLLPSKPNKMLNLALGLVVGVVGGIGLAFLIESLGTRLYSSKQIEEVANFALIGKIPLLPRRSLLTFGQQSYGNINTPFREAFRRLHIQLFMQNHSGPNQLSAKTFLVTSSEPGEGKSTITTNLAIAIAQSGKKVILVDCDLHIPTQHKRNGLENTVGLSTVLSKHTNLEKAVVQGEYRGMFLLTSGPLPSLPTNLLGSPQMKALLKELSEQFDVILLDAPAILVVSETAILAPIVDGVVFVARRNFIHEEPLREACKQLRNNKANVIGLVINEAESNGSYSYYQNR